MIRWCRNCILPDTRPNLVIGPDGVCNACKTHATKPQIDWKERGSAFEAVVANAKARSEGWDCVIPVSGGKDSTWQVVTMLEHGLNPLCVTWKTPARTEIGRRNLENMIALGVDHMDVQISPRVERHFMLKALERYGDSGVPMHMALHAIPLQIALRFNIPLVIFGENPAFEYGSPEQAHMGYRIDGSWLKLFGRTHGTTEVDWRDGMLTDKTMRPYRRPSEAELERADVRAVFLGHYFKWDPQEVFEVASRHGFQAAETARTGLWSYADIDDDFISVHHHPKWYKFGFTRLFDNLSVDIRNGRITRADAIEVVRRTGDQTPTEDIEKFCAFVGIPTKRFFEIMETFRNPQVWRNDGGTWRIPGFLIEDWKWA
ncbi:MAG TPA: N-acetyl sugar amidotransferase [Azospirillaceae bacterium]|nr:N-acetyl sugar amidotransferase [Azospirillaceae bacterium]